MDKPISCMIPEETWNAAARRTPKQEALAHYDSAVEFRAQADIHRCMRDYAQALRDSSYAIESLQRAVRVLIDQVPE